MNITFVTQSSKSNLLKMEEKILVSKNGIEDEMNQTVWDRIGGDQNKDGWVRISKTPPEVVEIKSKKAEAKKLEIAMEEESPEGTIEEMAEPVKKIKKGKK